MKPSKPPANPPGCVDVETHEARLTALADDVEAAARASLEKYGSISVGIANAFRTALAARKAAALLADARADRAYGRDVLEHEKIMAGLGRRQQLRRPPLQYRKAGDGQ